MGRTVLLLHRLPEGSSHYDWLTQVDPGGPLLAFRVTDRIDLPEIGRFRAQRLPDHRPAYLDYEGPVSGNRGTVERVAAGRAEVRVSAAVVLVTLEFGHGPRSFRGSPEAGGSDPGDSPWWAFASTGLEAGSSVR
ncbi:MAG: hypothetical protein IT436_15510 [Phycisphaerales bacterium]|nr:hypothetical protein [Phycisphaerales bacterium]